MWTCLPGTERAKHSYLGIQALEQVLSQRGKVAEALQGGVEEAGVAKVAKPRAHPVHPLPLEAGLDATVGVELLLRGAADRREGVGGGDGSNEREGERTAGGGREESPMK